MNKKNKCKGQQVSMVLFINPHVFYVMDPVEKHADRNKLEVFLEAVENPEELSVVEVNDLVLVDSLDGWRRALVQRVYITTCLQREDAIGVGADKKTKIYVCWLIDYCREVESIKVHKISQEIANIPPLPRRACLNNIVPCTESCDIKTRKMKMLPIDQFDINISKQIMEIVNDGRITKLVFTINYEENGISFGRLHITAKSVGSFDLSDKLVKNGLALYNEEYFEKLKRSTVFSNIETNQPQENLIYGGTNITRRKYVVAVPSKSKLKVEETYTVNIFENKKSNESKSKHCAENTFIRKVLESTPNSKKKSKTKNTTTEVELNKEEENLSLPTDIISSTSNVKRNKICNILIHGCDPPSPIISSTMLNYHKYIHRAMKKLNMDTATTLQSYSWPLLHMRETATVIIDGPATGKALSYLPGILSFNLDKSRYSRLEKLAPGPISVILCSGAKHVEHLAEEINELLRQVTYDHNVHVINACPPMPVKTDFFENYWSKCDILITTPKMLRRLFEQHISLARLCHLVLDDVFYHDMYLDVRKIMKECEINIRNRNFSAQFIMVSREWSEYLGNLLTVFEDEPVICIQDFLQAAVYGKLNFNIQFISNKLNALCEIIEQAVKFHKTVLVCENDDEKNYLWAILTTCNINAVLNNNYTSLKDIETLENEWNLSKCGSFPVWICTDEDFEKEFLVHNVTCLIHYYFPNSWNVFSRRFKCLLDCIPAHFSKKNDNGNLIKGEVVIYLNEKHVAKFPRVKDLMEKLKCNTIPSQLITDIEVWHTKTENEKIKFKIPLCDNIKLFGNCTNMYKCSHRHNLEKSIDFTSNNFVNGIIKYYVIFAKNPTTFYARILEYTDINGKIKPFYDYIEMNYLLIKYFNYFENIDHPKTVKIGEVYAIQHGNYFHRVMIKRIIHNSLPGDSVNVIIILLDAGSEIETKICYLLNIPQSIKDYPSQVHECCIANLGPPDGDKHWSCATSRKLMNVLETVNITVMDYCFSEIYFQIGQTIWLKDVVLLNNPLDYDLNCIRYSFKENAVNVFNSAEVRPEHVNSLLKMCNKANISITQQDIDAKIELPKMLELQQVEPTWAALDIFQYSEVHLGVVEKDYFLVKLSSQSQILDNLHAKINCTKLITDFDIEFGKYYLVRDNQNNVYNRVRVLNIEDDYYKVFFVDYGDTAFVHKKDFAYLSNEFILALPFQVIECRLYGINVRSGSWSRATEKFLYNNYTFIPKLNKFNTLYVMTEKLEAPKVTGSKRYVIQVISKVNDRGVLLNHEMISLKLEEAEKSEPFKTDRENQDILSYLLNKMLKSKLEDEYITHSSVAAPKGTQSNVQAFLAQLKNYLAKNNESYLLPASKFPKFKKMEIRNNNFFNDTKYTRPPVLWHQTIDSVNLTVQLPEQINYTTEVFCNEILNFEANFQGKNYKFSLNLYGKVENHVEHYSVGSKVILTVFKLEEATWPRLLNLMPDKVFNDNSIIDSQNGVHNTCKQNVNQQISDSEFDSDYV